MIQDNDIEVLDKVYYTPITPELVVREGFEREVQYPHPSKYPLIGELQFIHKELDIRLTQYDHHNIIVAKSGYPYCYTVNFELPIPDKNSSFSGDNKRQMSTFSYSIYTYGQLLAIIEAKRKLNALQESIEDSITDIILAVNKSNKYKTSK